MSTSKTPVVRGQGLITEIRRSGDPLTAVRSVTSANTSSSKSSEAEKKKEVERKKKIEKLTQIPGKLVKFADASFLGLGGKEAQKARDDGWKGWILKRRAGEQRLDGKLLRGSQAADDRLDLRLKQLQALTDYVELMMDFFRAHPEYAKGMKNPSQQCIDLIKQLEETRLYSHAKQYMTRAIMEIVWLLHALPLPLIAQYISRHCEKHFLQFLHEARNGDPRCFETFAKLPLVNVRNQNVGFYAELDAADERDGPLPLFGSALAKKLGYYVCKIGDKVLYFGVGRKGEAEMLELVRKNGWKVGNVMKLREGDRPSRTGLGRRVAEHSDPQARQALKKNSSGTYSVPASKHSDMLHGVADRSPKAIAAALEAGRTYLPTKNPRKMRRNMRVGASTTGAPKLAELIEWVSITAGGAAVGSPLFDQASKDLDIKFKEDRGFFTSNVQIGLEASLSTSDPASQSAKGMVGGKKTGGIAFTEMWEMDPEGMLYFSSEGGKANGKIQQQRVVVKTLEGYVATLRNTGNGGSNPMPRIQLSALKNPEKETTTLKNLNLIKDEALATLCPDWPTDVATAQRVKGNPDAKKHNAAIRKLLKPYKEITYPCPIRLFPLDSTGDNYFWKLVIKGKLETKRFFITSDQLEDHNTLDDEVTDLLPTGALQVLQKLAKAIINKAGVIGIDLDEYIRDARIASGEVVTDDEDEGDYDEEDEVDEEDELGHEDVEM